MLLNGDRSSFQKELQSKSMSYATALRKWGSTHFVYPFLSPELQHSLITCLAIQLTEKTPVDLPHFLD
jgi:hypothetical protein